MKVRRLIEDTEYRPVVGYTFQGEIDEAELPPRDTRAGWEHAARGRLRVNPAKATPRG